MLHPRYKPLTFVTKGSILNLTESISDSITAVAVAQVKSSTKELSNIYESE